MIIMKFTTFLSLMLPALFICQFNMLLAMKRKHTFVPKKLAKEQKLSFDCPLKEQHCQKNNMEKVLCSNNNGAGFERKNALEIHLLNFHHACPKCPYINNISLQRLSAHIHHEHNMQTSICDYCNNYITPSLEVHTLNNHKNQCVPFQSSFFIECSTKNQLQNKSVKNTEKNKHGNHVQNNSAQPMSMLEITQYNPHKSPKKKASASSLRGLNEITNGNFNKNIFKFTLPEADKTKGTINVTPEDKNEKDDSIFYCERCSFLAVTTVEQEAHKHRENNFESLPLDACNEYQTSQYPLPPLELLPSPISTESCEIEQPFFYYVEAQVLDNFPHLEPASTTIQDMPFTLVRCSLCPEKFTSQQNMKKHAVAVHLECPQLECTHQDSTAAGLMIHTMKQHFDENISIFPCIDCNAFAATDRQETIAHQQSCCLTEQYSY